MSAPVCADCFSGHIHSGQPAGTVATIHGLPTYIASPEDGQTPKGLVVIISDAFGWDLVNNRLLADAYAKKGPFLVYLPDFMQGNAMPPTLLTLMNQILSPSSWLTTLFFKPLWVLHALTMAVPFMIRTRTSVSKPLVFNFFSALRTSPPPFPLPSGQKELKIGAAGFCWGGKYTILLAGDAPSSRVHGWTAPASASASAGGVEGQQVAGLGPGAVTQTLSPLINAAFTAHPSNVDVPREVPAVKIPLSVCIGDTDLAMPSKQIQYMKSTLEGLSKKEVDGVEHEVVVLPGAKHGFAIRMDPKETKQMEFAEIAERQAVGWFGRWFA